MQEELKRWTREEESGSQRKAKKSGEENQSLEEEGVRALVKEEGQPEGKVQRAQEMVEDSEEVDGDGAGTGVQKGQSG